MRRLAAVLLVLVLAVVMAVTFVPPVRTAATTLLLVPELLDLPVRPLSALSARPTRETTTYADPPDRLDIYLPAGARRDGSRPAVVLQLGIHPQPLDHPDVVAVADAFARIGLVVGVPDSTALRDTRVEPEEPDRLARAVEVVAARPEVDPARVGLAGFSAGASLSLVAAAEPSIADRLRFVSAFGAYADARLLLVDVATRTAVRDGATIAWPVEPRIRGDILTLLLAALGDDAAAADLRVALEPAVLAETPPTGPDPAVEARFTGDALAAYRLFTAADRTAAERALVDASPTLLERLEAISPVAVADAIRAPVYLLHGEPDRSIPVTHAWVLRDVLPAGTVRKMTTFGRFEHIQPGEGGLGLEDLPDVWALTLHLHDLVATATE
jgi:dienelactone hydrolase